MSDTPLDPSATLDVVMALLALSIEGWPAIMTGRLPDEWPTTLLPPEGATAVGGMVRDDSRTALFRFPASIEDPLREYCRRVEANGWHDPQALLRGTFALSSTGKRHSGGNSRVYCNGPFIVSIGTRDDEQLEGLVTVTVRPCDGFPCVGEHPHLAFANDGLVPRLLVGERENTIGAGRCGGGDHTTHNMRLTSDRSPEELLPTIASQLESAGWKLSAATINHGVATQWIEKSHDTAVWRGVLGVYANGMFRDVFVHITKAT